MKQYDLKNSHLVRRPIPTRYASTQFAVLILILSLFGMNQIPGYADEWRYAQDIDAWYLLEGGGKVDTQRGDSNYNQTAMTRHLVHVKTREIKDGKADIELHLFNVKKKTEDRRWDQVRSWIRIDEYGSILKTGISDEWERHEKDAVVASISECFVGLPGYAIRENETWLNREPEVPEGIVDPRTFANLVFTWKKGLSDDEDLAVFESWFQEIQGNRNNYSPPEGVFKSWRQVEFSLTESIVARSERVIRAQLAHGGVQEYVVGNYESTLLTEQEEEEWGVDELVVDE